MKVVIFDDADYAYAKEVASCFPDLPAYLQVGNDHLSENGTGPAPSARPLRVAGEQGCRRRLE